LSNELIINSTQDESRIALLKDKKLVEFHQEKDETKFTVGDIYLGTVQKVVQGLNAAFVDIGYEKDAFLHYLDLGPQIQSLNKFVKSNLGNSNPNPKLSTFKREADINKLGKIGQVLTRHQKILVQVVKEPISTKGPRLSCELSIPGRYLVLVPFSDTVNVSKKIGSSEERKRLVRLITSIKPKNFGIIIRTVAQNKDVAELDRDLRNIVSIWEKGIQRLTDVKPRDKVIGEMNRANSILRDMLNEGFDNIYVDNKELHDEIRDYIRTIAPTKEKILKLYSGKAKIFEAFNIEKQLKSLFGQSVSVAGGGYLIIEHTEALHVIDVNSGNKSNAQDDQENNALHVNLDAAREIARQLRVRDMGGIIVVDFIDMKRAENKKKLYEKMKEEMKDDRSKFTILPLSKFGLMQITRQRVRPELNIKTREVCPSCNGTGKISASIMITDEIEKNIDHLLKKQNEPNLTLALHPYLYAFFRNGMMSRQVKWLLKYHKWVALIEDSSLALTEHTFVNKGGEVIEVVI
jgi:ribonuclease G